MVVLDKIRLTARLQEHKDMLADQAHVNATARVLLVVVVAAVVQKMSVAVATAAVMVVAGLAAGWCA